MGVIKIDIDAMSIANQIAPQLDRAVQSSMSVTLAMLKDRWTQEVQKKLHSTIPLYLMGLDFNSIMYPYQGNPMVGAVELHGKFPNMLEQGFSAFDMKVGFSKSPRAHKKQDGGWFLTIPIRHSTPGAFMYGNAMPKDVYGVAKKLGDREQLTPDQLVKLGRNNVTTSWNGYQHKSDIYAGLTRIIKSYNNSKQSQYMTFRRVSDKSDPLSWQHPGFIGTKIAETLEPFASETFNKLLQYNLS